VARYRNADWNLPGPKVDTWEQAGLAVLMDIREELQALNRTLGCYRVIQMCEDVRKIDRRIAKRIPLRAKRK
jgi:hypothetical protein